VRVAEKHKATPIEVVSSETLFQGRVFELKRDHVREPGGIEATREIIVHRGSVVVLPVLPDGRILMIRQYRHAAGQALWELVAGHREEHETFLEAAPRELQEETGYTAQRFTKLVEFYPSPGLLSEKMVVYLAEELTKGRAKQEEDEKIAQRAVSLAELESWIRSGKIKDAKSIASILYYSKFVAHVRKSATRPKRKKR
jgi:ADP-ribose pyrophosphatase